MVRQIATHPTSELASLGQGATTPYVERTHRIRALVFALEQVKLEQMKAGTGTLLSAATASPDVALAVLDAFALPYEFSAKDLEAGHRSVLVLLWPSNLVRAGVAATRHGELRDFSDLAYRTLSDSQTRTVTTALARKANPIIARLAEEKLPPVDRANEYQSAQNAASVSKAPSGSEMNSAPTSQRRTRRSHPWRTAAVATLLGTGAALIVRQHEAAVGELISQSPVADALVTQTASHLEFLSPISDFCMRHLDQLLDFFPRTSR